MTVNYPPLSTDQRQPLGPRAVRIALPLIVFVGLLAATFGPAAARSEAAATLSIYKNALDTSAKRSQIFRYGSEGQCKRGKASKAFRFSLGKQTRECFFRLPAVGRSVEVSAVGVLFDSTPEKVIGRTYLAVSTRQTGNGSRYQLAVFPSQRKWELRKVEPNGAIEYLATGKNQKEIKGPGRSNRILLRSFNGVKGQPSTTARLVARINGKRVVVFNDARGLQLTGRITSFSIGSPLFATGAAGSFREVDVRIPDPF